MSIMYGCDRCASVDPERCAFHGKSELRVVGDQWLCEHCFDFREPIDDRYWKDYPSPPEYGPVDRLIHDMEREGQLEFDRPGATAKSVFHTMIAMLR